jgi:hypothetical protein
MAGGTLRTAAGSLSRSWLVLAGAARHSCFAHYGSQWPIRPVGVAVRDGHSARCHGLSVVQRGVERPATAHAGQNSSLQWCNLLAVSIAGCLVRHDCRRFAVILETHPVLWSCRQFVLYPGAVGLSERRCRPLNRGLCCTAMSRPRDIYPTCPQATPFLRLTQELPWAMQE